MRKVVTISEINGTKIELVKRLHEHGDDVCVIEDAKFKSINEQNEAWISLKKSVHSTYASYEAIRVEYGAKVHAFNGRWSNNPAKIAALENVSKYGTSWIFEDDVYCKGWSEFFSKYNGVGADFLCTVTQTSRYPWFVNGWLVGDRRHVSTGVAGLYAFRISQRAATAVIERVRLAPHLSHHELFVPWAIKDACLSHAQLADEHAENMCHNHTARGDNGRSVEECENHEGMIFHPVKSPISRAITILGKTN